MPAEPPLAGANGPTGQGGKELRAPADPRFGAFITGVGEFSHVGETTNAKGYDLATGGFTLGADYRLTDHFTVGVNTGYARSGADLGGGGRVTVDGAKKLKQALPNCETISHSPRTPAIAMPV